MGKEAVVILGDKCKTRKNKRREITWFSILAGFVPPLKNKEVITFAVASKTVDFSGDAQLIGNLPRTSAQQRGTKKSGKTKVGTSGTGFEGQLEANESTTIAGADFSSTLTNDGARCDFTVNQSIAAAEVRTFGVWFKLEEPLRVHQVEPDEVITVFVRRQKGAWRSVREASMQFSVEEKAADSRSARHSRKVLGQLLSNQLDKEEAKRRTEQDEDNAWRRVIFATHPRRTVLGKAVLRKIRASTESDLEPSGSPPRKQK